MSGFEQRLQIVGEPTVQGPCRVPSTNDPQTLAAVSSARNRVRASEAIDLSARVLKSRLCQLFKNILQHAGPRHDPVFD